MRFILSVSLYFQKKNVLMKTKQWFLLIWLAAGLVLTACNSESEATEETPPAVVTGNPAIDGLTQEIMKNPEDATLYAKRGKVFYDNKGYDEAIIDFTFAVKLDSTQIEYYHLLANTYMEYFKSRKALQVMKQAAQLFPDDITTLLQLSDYQLILKQYDESMKTINGVLERDPQNAMAYFMFGMNFKETGDTIRAINSFQKAVEFDADITDGWLNLGELYEAIGDPLAARYYDNAIRIAPNDIIAIHSKADYLSRQNDLQGAINMYRQIVRIDPQYEDAYFNSGLIYLDMDSIQQAKQQFDLTVKTSPTHIRAYYYRGLSSEMLGANDAAKNDYEQALKMAPNYEKAQEGLERLGGK